MTGGRGDYSMSFLRYEEVPSHIAQKIIEEPKRKEQRGGEGIVIVRKRQARLPDLRASASARFSWASARLASRRAAEDWVRRLRALHRAGRRARLGPRGDADDAARLREPAAAASASPGSPRSRAAQGRARAGCLRAGAAPALADRSSDGRGGRALQRQRLPPHDRRHREEPRRARVSFLPLSGTNPEVVITVAWDISWYQYRVVFESAQPVRLAERGYELDELDDRFKSLERIARPDGRRRLIFRASSASSSKRVSADHPGRERGERRSKMRR